VVAAETTDSDGVILVANYAIQPNLDATFSCVVMTYGDFE
jgi:hypothetical protein